MEANINVQVDRNLVGDVVKAILCSIFFQRYFGSLQPKTLTRDLFDVTYLTVDVPELSQLIDEKVSELTKRIDEASSRSLPGGGGGGGLPQDKKQTQSSPTSSSSFSLSSSSSASSIGSAPLSSGEARIVVGFLEKKPPQKRSMYFFSKGEEDVYWEHWVINVTALGPGRNENERLQLRRLSESELRQAILQIIMFANEHKDHIPPITTVDSTLFPYRIIVPSTTAAAATSSTSPVVDQPWGAVLKKVLD